MSNMGYCRFRNTVEDMIDCINKLEEVGFYVEDLEQDASEDEKRAINKFVKLCELVSSQV